MNINLGERNCLNFIYATTRKYLVRFDQKVDTYFCNIFKVMTETYFLTVNSLHLAIIISLGSSMFISNK